MPDISWLEYAANAMTLVCIVLAGRNSVHTWWTGIVGCLLFAGLFFQAKLYADVTLQLFFLITGIIGWLNWNSIEAREITPASKRWIIVGSLVGIATAFGYGYLLHTFTDAYAPFMDSLVLAFSVLGQLLLMKRHIQTWPVWLIVNTISVPLFWSRELYLTAILYSGFWINAIVAWFHWHNLMNEKSCQDSVPVSS